MSSSTLRTLKWLAAALAGLLALPLLALLVSAIVGWNWARAPLQDWALRQTGVRPLTVIDPSAPLAKRSSRSAWSSAVTWR